MRNSRKWYWASGMVACCWLIGASSAMAEVPSLTSKAVTEQMRSDTAIYGATMAREMAVGRVTIARTGSAASLSLSVRKNLLRSAKRITTSGRSYRPSLIPCCDPSGPPTRPGDTAFCKSDRGPGGPFSWTRLSDGTGWFDYAWKFVGLGPDSTGYEATGSWCMDSFYLITAVDPWRIDDYHVPGYCWANGSSGTGIAATGAYATAWNEATLGFDIWITCGATGGTHMATSVWLIGPTVYTFH